VTGPGQATRQVVRPGTFAVADPAMPVHDDDRRVFAGLPGGEDIDGEILTPALYDLIRLHDPFGAMRNRPEDHDRGEGQGCMITSEPMRGAIRGHGSPVPRREKKCRFKRL